ncbi:hypothetical protein [Rufibacter quisquiliarum]|uniref:Uncharacterized protein n=1 Tax=Rufibacter quisquiliarum TaxID=1549639 RepID=A0A839GGY2_9BACT|nr:hypothetical protein [Rufibacter quisquiliarum]MBA9076853.1 hypothetical protein [Rufibacter quisquiliarum]
MSGKHLIFVIFLILQGQMGVRAQTGTRPRQDQQGLRQELAQYHQQTIGTFLLAKRRELDRQLSAADRRTLAQLREEVANHRTQQLAYFQKVREERKASRQPLSEAHKAEIKAQHAHYQQLMGQVTLIANRNQKALTAVATQVKAQQEKWYADLQAIASRYRGTGGDSTLAKRALVHERRRSYWSLTRFLLLDPNSTETYLEELVPKGTDETNSGNLQERPTPVAAQSVVA